MTALKALSRETLPEQIAKQLLQYIVTENLQPGDLLPSEIRLAEDFGVSRSVVREAMRAMAAQGAIEVVNGKGAMVRPVDDSVLRLFFQRAIDIGHGSYVELMEIRKALEVQSAGLAAQRRTPRQAESLQRTVAAMQGELANLTAYAELDVEFHLLAAEAAHNHLLYHLISSIRKLLKDVVLAGLSRRDKPEQLERIQAVHAAIAAAIVEGDAAAARQGMTTHFDEAIVFLGHG